MEKSCDLGKDVRDGNQATYPTTHNKWKEPIIPDEVDTPTNDELSLSSSLSLSLSPTKNARESAKAKSHKRPSHHPAFSDAVSGASRRARRETSRRQNQPIQALGNTSILLKGATPPVLPIGTMPPMPLIYPAFVTGPAFYMLPTALIRRPDDMLSSPLGQYILDYEPPRAFVIPFFATFDGSTDPYDHMLHYNQAMILNACNDRLLCKVFPSSLRKPKLAWFHKLPRNSINLFNEL